NPEYDAHNRTFLKTDVKFAFPSETKLFSVLTLDQVTLTGKNIIVTDPYINNPLKDTAKNSKYKNDLAKRELMLRRSQFISIAASQLARKQNLDMHLIFETYRNGAFDI